MKARFDWQTEDDNAAESPRFSSAFPSSRNRFGCLFTSLIVSAFLIGSIAWLLQRQAEAIARVEEDVIAVFELQQHAARTGDAELFSAMLSSTDRAWKRDQEELLARAFLNDRSSIGLLDGTEAAAPTDVELSPDFSEAKLTYKTIYLMGPNFPQRSSIELVHTLAYRLEDGRWRNAPPDASFWGPWNELDGDLFSISYPERDAELVELLALEMNSRLNGLCAAVNESNMYGSAFCAGQVPWRIRLSSSPQTLLNLLEPVAVPSTDIHHELPAPSVVGIPLHEGDIDVYIKQIAGPFLQRFEAALLATTPYPEQSIYALCFDHPLRGRHLYRYDWRLRSWHPILSSKTFHHLSAKPDDSAVLLADDDTLSAMVPIGASDSRRLAPAWQKAFPLIDAQRLVGWLETKDAPYFLLQPDPAVQAYSILDMQRCAVADCAAHPLPGFPVTSAVSEAMLYLEGSQITIATALDASSRPMGRGFSPFFVGKERFGFVRFAGDMDAGIVTQLILGDIESDGQHVLLDGRDLARAADLPLGSALFVNNVMANPADPGQLLISSTGIRSFSGQYFIFTADVPERLGDADLSNTRLELRRTGTQGGVPGLLSPTGTPPFVVSTNGRWLAMTELESQNRDTWTVLIHDLQTRATTEVSDGVPAMPGNFPLLDWSTDGQWLLVADRDYLHLIAPEHAYQEAIRHDFDACSHIVWSD